MGHGAWGMGYGAWGMRHNYYLCPSTYLSFFVTQGDLDELALFQLAEN